MDDDDELTDWKGLEPKEPPPPIAEPMKLRDLEDVVAANEALLNLWLANKISVGVYETATKAIANASRHLLDSRKLTLAALHLPPAGAAGAGVGERKKIAGPFDVFQPGALGEGSPPRRLEDAEVTVKRGGDE